ncbi:MAG TPA: hypothetical protein VFD01_09665 [Candidatus Dormibacteraeota bacterium]|jgi:hypothetical protein|nr:hypothetical protein [Candidatus Dormibacteraeota bacterium]
MGKKRVQVRQIRQMRQVRPRSLPVPASGDQRRQRERYVRSGGLLQGYAPEQVLRVGYATGAVALGCAIVLVVFLLLLPYGWPVRAVAAAVWLVPIAFGASFVLPGVRLALQDRKEEPKVVQGTLLGASEYSTQIGLGMLMVKTRGGVEQYLVPPDRLSKVPGNQVNVILTMTPRLRHVRGVGVVGQRLVPRPSQPAPPILRRLRLLPIATPVVLAAAAILGADVVAAVPIEPDLLHAPLAAAAALAGSGTVWGLSYLYQRRLVNEVQSLIPGGLQ